MVYQSRIRLPRPDRIQGLRRRRILYDDEITRAASPLSCFPIAWRPEDDSQAAIAQISH
jgi:hypothetical protein